MTLCYRIHHSRKKKKMQHEKRRIVFSRRWTIAIRIRADLSFHLRMTFRFGINVGIIVSSTPAVPQPVGLDFSMPTSRMFIFTASHSSDCFTSDTIWSSSRIRESLTMILGLSILVSFIYDNRLTSSCEPFIVIYMFVFYPLVIKFVAKSLGLLHEDVYNK